jgi:hypothetical protein
LRPDLHGEGVHEAVEGPVEAHAARGNPLAGTCQTHDRFGRVLGVAGGVSAGHPKERRRRCRGAVVEPTATDIEHMKERLG